MASINKRIDDILKQQDNQIKRHIQIYGVIFSNSFCNLQKNIKLKTKWMELI